MFVLNKEFVEEAERFMQLLLLFIKKLFNSSAEYGYSNCFFEPHYFETWGNKWLLASSVLFIRWYYLVWQRAASSAMRSAVITHSYFYPFRLQFFFFSGRSRKVSGLINLIFLLNDNAWSLTYNRLDVKIYVILNEYVLFWYLLS